ncbi:FAD:protein FMN transferase [Pelodictyon luteolum]|uniref:FAD:protein FMN transferase n=1 Tax=Chlorobium luteolum (strain DSM 273 / BCRC 81028 / 2530) TaxID=319225 RepID=Q3B2K8_CHLL3|nr:FAD:protein FMN transferase [Pelodictyon luteolum]ABB24423.1 ApbE family protein [Pelodictyon luteolum DSM 273]
MDIFRFGFTAMAGDGEMVIAAESRREAQRVSARAIEEVSRIECRYSRYRPDGVLAAINGAAGKGPLPCDRETGSLLRYADVLYGSSEGLFDITSGILRTVWDFKKGTVPGTDELAAALGRVGWAKVELQERSIVLPEGMQIDFGGFGKEYASDRAAACLHQDGIRHGYVNLAGDIRVVGPKPDGSAWSIGIRDPRQRERSIASVPLFSGALATSGDYERYFEADGHRYCHVLSPLTGYPVTYWRSVSVVAPTATAAGSLSTIAMLKEKDGLAFLEESGMAYFAVDRTGTIHQRNCELEVAPCREKE